MSRRRIGFFASALLTFLSLSSALGQGTTSYTVLRTGSGPSVITDQQQVQLAGVVSPQVVFSFGFITGEVPTPGTFLDAFTVSFQNPAFGSVAVLATVDPSGTLWFPATPGGLVLSDSQVQRQSIAPPNVPDIQGQGVAYSVALSVPAQLLGPTLNVTFDLFDNQNGVNSLGWHSSILVVSVPEPSAVVLALSGFIIVALRKWLNR